MAAGPFSLGSPAHTRPCLCVSNTHSALHPQAALSNHRNKSLACGNKMWLIFLSKVEIENQEVEIALSTPLDYNLVRGRNKHLFNNESCVFQSGSNTRSQVLVLVLITCWITYWSLFYNHVHSVIVYEASISFACKGSSCSSMCCWGKYGSSNFFHSGGEPYRETQSRQSMTVLSCVWLAVLWLTAGIFVTDK